MLEFVTGDMFERPADIRVNTVNCEGVMGAGVALAFKRRYPEMFRDYQAACRDGRLAPGRIHVWRSLSGEWVINFPTKRHWRDGSRYEDIETGLKSLREYLAHQGAVRVSLPALGCGHGGLDWSRVSSMIREELDGLEAKIEVYEPSASRRAGASVKSELTADELVKLQVAGFESHRFSESDSEFGQTILLRGSADVLQSRWVALTASRMIGERERDALGAIAKQMGRADGTVTIAFIHGSRDADNLARIFLSEGVRVVSITPFGVLSRKTLPLINSDGQQTFISVAPPAAPWSRAIFAQSMNLLHANASALLVSDPDPSWLNQRAASAWVKKQVYYVRYGSSGEDSLAALRQIGARPIGRRSDTGEPNVTELIGCSPPALPLDSRSTSKTNTQFEFALDSLSE